jgi:hypothetical protein
VTEVGVGGPPKIIGQFSQPGGEEDPKASASCFKNSKYYGHKDECRNGTPETKAPSKKSKSKACKENTAVEASSGKKPSVCNGGGPEEGNPPAGGTPDTGDTPVPGWDPSPAPIPIPDPGIA